MARPKKPLLDEFLETYRSMDPDERPLALAALRGFDAALAPVKVKPLEQQAFAELGGRAAGGE